MLDQLLTGEVSEQLGSFSLMLSHSNLSALVILYQKRDGTQVVDAVKSDLGAVVETLSGAFSRLPKNHCHSTGLLAGLQGNKIIGVRFWVGQLLGDGDNLGSVSQVNERLFLRGTRGVGFGIGQKAYGQYRTGS